jgi:hypothetical protein
MPPSLARDSVQNDILFDQLETEIPTFILFCPFGSSNNFVQLATTSHFRTHLEAYVGI